MLELDQLPHDLNALVDSYRDKRVAYKYERRHCLSPLCCIPVYFTVTPFYVLRRTYLFDSLLIKQIEPGLVFILIYHSP